MARDDPGGRDAVRESVMQWLRAGIRQRQMRGDALETIRTWIQRQWDDGAITEEEAAIARLMVRHYTNPATRSGY